jgi:hypothetical protein
LCDRVIGQASHPTARVRVPTPSSSATDYLRTTSSTELWRFRGGEEGRASAGPVSRLEEDADRALVTSARLAMGQLHRICRISASRASRPHSCVVCKPVGDTPKAEAERNRACLLVLPALKSTPRPQTRMKGRERAAVADDADPRRGHTVKDSGTPRQILIPGRVGRGAAAAGLQHGRRGRWR